MKTFVLKMKLVKNFILYEKELLKYIHKIQFLLNIFIMEIILVKDAFLIKTKEEQQLQL